jgi:hypothetical protein
MAPSLFDRARAAVVPVVVATMLTLGGSIALAAGPNGQPVTVPGQGDGNRSERATQALAAAPGQNRGGQEQAETAPASSHGEQGQGDLHRSERAWQALAEAPGQNRGDEEQVEVALASGPGEHGQGAEHRSERATQALAEAPGQQGDDPAPVAEQQSDTATTSEEGAPASETNEDAGREPIALSRVVVMNARSEEVLVDTDAITDEAEKAKALEHYGRKLAVHLHGLEMGSEGLQYNSEDDTVTQHRGEGQVVVYTLGEGVELSASAL